MLGLIVVGCGTSGIATARFYLEVHPTADVLVIERDDAVGGVWSTERVYPGFRSQGGVRISGFSDLPFEPAREEVDAQDFFSAKEMSRYLEGYVRSHVYNGRSILDRVTFGNTVSSIERIQDGWGVTCRPTGSEPPASSMEMETGAETVHLTRKLVIASGSTSVPTVPKHPGMDAFGGPIVHTLNFGRSKIFERKDVKRVAVIGGGKSAADMVYECISHGLETTWVIRKSGKGPGCFVSQDCKKIGFENLGELAATRAFPSIMVLPGLQAMGWWQYFLYKTRAGVWLLGKMKEMAGKQMVGAARYDDRPGARPSFKLLKTEMEAMVFNAPAGGVHHEDFWDKISRNVDVIREDVDRLEEGKIVFKDGSEVEADAILLGTGFSPSFPFVTTEQAIELGLPHPRAAEPKSVQWEWETLETEAELKVRERMYTLASPPKPPPEGELGDINPNVTPYRLYNCIAPTDPKFGNSIAFIGFSTLVNMFANSEVAAIWITAYLDGLLKDKLPSEEEMKKEVAYVTTYMRMRNPTFGRVGNFYAFDYFPYLDRLLGEVGLNSYRKGWWREMFRPLLTRDFKGLKDEYIGKYGRT